MNKQETIKIMRVLSANYKSYFDKLNQDELEALMLTYDYTFKNYSFEDVQRAVLQHIRTNIYQSPNIAEINRILAPKLSIDFDEMFDVAWKNLSANRGRANGNWDKLTKTQQEFISVDLLVRLGKSLESDKPYLRKELINDWSIKVNKINNSLLVGETKYLPFVKETKLLEG